MALTDEERADLELAAEMGLVSEAVVAELKAKLRRVEAARRLPSNRRESERAVMIQVVRVSLDIAKRELAMALENPAERSVEAAESQIDKLERQLAELTRNRTAVRSGLPKLDLPEEAEEGIAIVRRLRELEEHLSRVATMSKVRSPTPIGELDATLCLAWENIAPTEGSGSDAISVVRSMKPYLAARLLSARNAEKAAAAYYKRLGQQVEDVSVSQLVPGATAWKEFDLRVGDVSVDVKNARESFNGGGNYVEHCVPKFKRDRGTGAHVRIAGVVSPYVSEPREYLAAGRLSTMLGEVDAQEITELIEWTSERFEGRLDLRNMLREGFLPGWLFEFGTLHYVDRGLALADAPALLRRMLDALAYSCEIPGWLWIFSDEPVPASLPAARVLSELRRMRGGPGLTRRSLYALALGFAIEELALGPQGESQLALLLQACRLRSHRNGASLLGLHDPLAYVSNLVPMLAEIVTTVRTRGLKVVGFRLAHPAILQGVLDSGRRITLFAYCGGWQTYPTPARCGKMPLTIATHESCINCGHLICDACGNCSERCDENQPRQNAVAASHQRADGSRASISGEGYWDIPF